MRDNFENLIVLSDWVLHFQSRCIKEAIELHIAQLWSEIILVISNQTCAARSFNVEIMHLISDKIAVHSVQLLLLIW